MRVDAIGNVDTNFNSVSLASGTYPDWVQALVCEPNGNILCGGRFPRHFMRLTPTGALNSASLFAASPVFALALQDDGRLLVGGSGLDRRTADGNRDVSFIGSSLGTVRAIAVQADGKIVVGGDFTNWGGRPSLVRLMPGGVLDYSFDAHMAVGAKVMAILVQTDGRIVIGGVFASAGGLAFKGLARLNDDGSGDARFDIGAGFASPTPTLVATLARQPDGKFLVGGGFTSVAGLPRRALVRLNPDGHLDSTFDTGAGPDGPVYALALEPDGNVIIVGDFNHVDGQSRDRLARLFGDHPPPLAPRLGLPTVLDGHVSMTFPSELDRKFTLEFTDVFSPAQWTPAASVLGDGGVLPLADTNAPPSQRFYRLRVE